MSIRGNKYMKLVCSRCSCIIREDSADASSERIITHGTCDECTNFLLWPNRPELMDFLDGIDAPIVIIDSSGNVSTANGLARELLQKELPEIEGFQGGNVFECVFAKLPEGCGKTLHCDGCTIRNTVMSTIQSGISHMKIPAGLSRGTSDDIHDIQFVISTEKVNDVVMLRIDNVCS